MNKFFSQSNCDNCGGSLKEGMSMSMFSTQCLCIKCIGEEKNDKDYKKAVEADHEHIRRGEYNFKGIRGGKVK